MWNLFWNDAWRRARRVSSGVLAAGVLLAAISTTGCDRSPPANVAPAIPALDAAKLPPAPAMVRVGPGVERGEVVLTSTTGQPMHVWVYRPLSDRPALDRSLPVVLIAPAGSDCITGNALAVEDEVEHLPWVKAGFAVLAYDLDGPLDRGATATAYTAAVRKFSDARGGTLNAAATLDYAAARLPQLDLQRVITVGHSSAANVALLVARDLGPQRVKAAVAFAPRADVASAFDRAFLDALKTQITGIGPFVTDTSPNHVVTTLVQPTFLFAAEDDATIDVAGVKALAQTMRTQGRSPQLVVVPRGGHYDAMLLQGIETAIAWAQREAGAAR